ncbi:hypothetical protein GCM10009552_34300 [Rothia nasimurium]|uniref:Filamentous hemagglutinin N-terminal domain-containing protein n=1 Tax=Luteibacter anthropi TaxID=564369 RepID=A0A7X5U8D5_9GAMM|nr:filamentous haemagglutinin family protein [Luteibacter anthropi]NII05786.1 filamentous hemagglutinin N-terminal domain-containing protein [Luteibacter anthropi]
MIVRTRTSAEPRRPAPPALRPTLRRRAVCHLIAIALSGSGAAHAATPPAFTPAWFASKQAGTTPAPAPAPGGQGGAAGGNVSFTPGSALLQQRVQQSIQNLDNAAAAVAAQMQAQKAAQSAAQQLASKVSDGVANGGLVPSAGIGADPSLWQNANMPTDTVAAGKHTVEVKQTDKKAILTWDSFNVGRNTTLYFNQSAGNQSDGKNDWIALNRINDPSAQPSQILGQMKAEGTVYLLNRNGVIFGAGSQVNTRSLIASSLNLFSDDVKASNARFLKDGIGVNDAPILTASFTDGRNHDVVIEKGASITSGNQGFVLVAAPNVSNAGSIVADDGHAILAASTVLTNRNTTGPLDLYDNNPARVHTDGSVTNTGIVQSRRGTVSILGYDVTQAGVVLASTSIAYPGAISLLAATGTFTPTNPAAGGTLELTKGSVTAILPEKDGTTTSSSAAADEAFVTGSVYMGGNQVRLDGGSLVEAPGANVTLQALPVYSDLRPDASRVYVDSGAIIDVSGIANVMLPSSALLITIPRIGQNELANSPLQRNSFLYTQKNVTVDGSVSGTRADGLDWIGSPILNVGGYVENVPRDISQMLTHGGNVTLDGRQVIVRDGSRISMDGGYLAYQAGWIDTPNLLGADGLIHNIADADPNVMYVGFAGQFTSNHARWGVSETYNSPIMGGSHRWSEGFVVGSDAGTMTVRAADALVLDGDISAQATPGTRQVANGTQPHGGKITINETPAALTRAPYSMGIRVQQSSLVLDHLTPGFNADTPWEDVLAAQDSTATDDNDLRSWLVVSADKIARAGFDSVDITSPSAIVVAAGSNLVVGAGGSVSLTGGRIDVNGAIAAPAGSISLTATQPIAAPGPGIDRNAVRPADITLADGASLSTRGLWVNDTAKAPEQQAGYRYINGGSISLQTQQAFSGDAAKGIDGTGSINLQQGSVIDVSGGGYVDAGGDVRLTHGVPAGHGGDVSLRTYVTGGALDYGVIPAPPKALNGGRVTMAGTILSEGFSGGGTLTLQAPEIRIGGQRTDLVNPNGLWLDPSFFASQGFDNYQLDAITDATIAKGTQVTVRHNNLVADVDALRLLGTGGDVRNPALSSLAQLAPYTRWATRDTRTGHGPGFSLAAGDYLFWNLLPGSPGAGAPSYAGATGTLSVEHGAGVDVDAGGAVSLRGTQATLIHGSVRAPGGQIDVGTRDFITTTPLPAVSTRVWLGSDSKLDASGIALIDPLAAAVTRSTGGLPTGASPRTGTILDGGSIGLASNSGYVVAEAGAVLDVSGTSDTFDVPVSSKRLNGENTDYVATPVWSDGGKITMLAAAGLYSSATLKAQGGSPFAEGGTLSLGGEHVINQNGGYPAPTRFVISASGGKLPDAASERGAIEAGSASGTLNLTADTLRDSGITTLQLGIDGTDILPVVFSGDVSLSLGRAFQAATNSLSATAGSHVEVNAPYLSFVGLMSPTASPSLTRGDAQLRMTGTQIDIGGLLSLANWASATFDASGDIRFVAPTNQAYTSLGQKITGVLYATGDLTFKAAQLYPVTDYSYAIIANAGGALDAHGNSLQTTITMLPGGASQSPLSAGGTLLLDADHIEQGGTIRAPSGSIILGVKDATREAAAIGLDPKQIPLVTTSSVHLAQGSVTSVSLDNQTVPYGSTIDGVQWRYNGSPVTASNDLTAPPSKQVALHGDNLSLDEGATIDLSGGGSLQAGEWVPGTGGSRDVLAQRATVPGGKPSSGDPLYADGRPIYAVLPGKQPNVASYDSAFAAQGGDGPSVGQQVYLSGVPGLPAGWYTLLPARYAEIAGAFRIVQQPGVGVAGRNVQQPDGSYVVSGYFGDGLSGAHDALTSNFRVQSRDVWQQYSQYTFTDADTFFGNKATKAGQVAPRLAADAGRLMLDAGSRLNLGTTLTAQPASKGRSSQVDIAAEAIQVLGTDTTARDGYLGLSADGLTQLGAGSLLLGGTRTSTTEGDRIDTVADSVLLSNDASHPLAGQEIMLVAKDGGTGDGVTLESGSVLQARGTSNPVGSQPVVFGVNPGTGSDGKPTPAVNGDGALVRVSQNGTAAVIRHQVTGVDGPAGTPSGKLTIDAGAVVQGGTALTLDATGRMLVDENASFTGSAIDANANRIAFVADGRDGGDNGLVIGSRTLNLFRNADQVTLRSRGEMDFLGDLAIALGKSLTLNAATMVGDGGNVSISAGTVAFGNALGTQPGATNSAARGRLAVSASEIDFGAGATAFNGFGTFTATAGQGMAGQGSGAVDFGAANVNLSAPVFLADSAANTALTTTGSMVLKSAAGQALDRDALGGSLSLTGSDIDLGMNVRATAGALSASATQGDVNVAAGTTLDVAGINRTFFDTTTYAPGGRLSLVSSKGNVNVAAGSSLRFGGGQAGGDAGTFTMQAAQAARLDGSIDGHAASGWRGGYFTYAAGTAVNLDNLARIASAAGATGLLDITSGNGDLVLSSGQRIGANKVYLYADGGTTRIDGSIDASGPVGGRIELYGRDGVDVEGSLDASSSIPEQRGGDVVIGTTGKGDGSLDPTYGYQRVQRADAGSIHVGPNATINVAGGSSTPIAGGRISFRAPLLADGDVPVQIDRPAGLTGARDVTVEPYAVWSTADASGDLAKHFDGIVDPSGWFMRDPSTGKPVMVAGIWTDATGKVLDAPQGDDQLKSYLSQYFFQPSTVNADHAGFYGYAGGDAANGPGTLMGFIQKPGFTFGSRFASIGNIHVRPGVELDNPLAANVDTGAIHILTNWNLGAGTTDSSGNISLAYRYGAEAPVLTFRAGGTVDVKASISDGFYQQNNGAVLNDPPVPVDDNGYSVALGEYRKSQAYMDATNLWDNGTINLKDGDASNGGTPGGGTANLTKDPYWVPLQAPMKDQSTTYYANYGRYIGEIGDNDNRQWAFTFNLVNSGPGFYSYSPSTLAAPRIGDYGTYADYVAAYQDWIFLNFFDFQGYRETTPAPLLQPLDVDYGAYSTNYAKYISGHADYVNYVSLNVGTTGIGTQLFYAPFAPRSDAAVRDPVYDKALAAYQGSLAYLDSHSLWDNGTINLKNGDASNGGTPGGGTADLTKDPYWAPIQAPLRKQSSDYYANYGRYIDEVGDGDNRKWAFTFNMVNSGPGFYSYQPSSLVAPQPGDFSSYDGYVAAYQSWIFDNFFDFQGFRETTPSPLLQPLDSDYKAYSSNYAKYISGHADYVSYVSLNVGTTDIGTQLFYAPFAPRADALPPTAPTNLPVPPATPDNSPSNMPKLGMPASFASATLLGGQSSSFRFVSGADFASANPLAVGASSGDVTLDGHFAIPDAVTDRNVVGAPNQYTGKTVLLPTTIRTGSGSIDVASSGDIRWLDNASPAGIYTAGVPADGTTAGTDVAVLRPSVKAPGQADTQPDMLVTGLVNPDRAGDISLVAKGDIDAIQNPTDPDGSSTRTKPGASLAQYWWQWMQTGNAADGSRSSINFGNFGQGVMSVGGNVSVNAGGDVSQLFVSLPTTWYMNPSGQGVVTVGGGDLSVHAGGDILSGGYFVARGKGRIDADGIIGASPDLAQFALPATAGAPSTPLSTIIAMQDGNVSVHATNGLDLGGVYNPSYYSAPGFQALLPAGHADSQSYSSDSSIDVSTTTGDLRFGSLKAPGAVFGMNGVAGPVLPATVSMTALDGAIDILADGQLYPSAKGNLTVMASDDISLSRQTVSDSRASFFGLIDSATSLPSPLNPITRSGTYILFTENSPLNYHDATPLHGDDHEPVRIYSLHGDIKDGIEAPNGFNYLSLLIAPQKQAMIYAGRDIVNLAFIGQHAHDADITRIAAGRDIYDTAFQAQGFDGYILNGYALPGQMLVGGPGSFLVEAGRDIGPLTTQAEVIATSTPKMPTGIQSVGNLYNPALPHEGADVNVAFGVGPGTDTAAFLARYLDQPDATSGLGSFDDDLVAFMTRRVAGQVVDTGYVKDKPVITLTVAQARQLLSREPEYVQRLFAERVLFRILATVGSDYNNALSPFHNQYARGYQALDSLFPAARGYTANGNGEGGGNGAAQPLYTGNLDIRSTTIQTQQGGDVTLVGPGGQIIVGSTAAPSQITDSNGNVLAGPNTMGILTLEKGNINIFSDRSVLLAQSRIFTEQGGNMVIWSSNGDINAGQGAKTTAEIPPPVYVCDNDAWCRLDARGQVSGAGIATLQTVEGAPPGSVYLIAPRGTVDAGDAGIRVSGDIFIAAARVANADNIQVKGESLGIPVVASVNIGALNAASAAAGAATKAAEETARKQQNDARDKLPSVISVHVLGGSDAGASVTAPDGASPVSVIGTGSIDSARASLLTPEERKHLKYN